MIGVVHHSFLSGNWREIISGQFKRLKDSGLYDSSDVIWCTVNLNGNDESSFNEIIKEYPKFNVEFHVDNYAEYPGIRKVKELGNSYDNLKLFYFHSKGVSNTYVVSGSQEKSEEKVRNIAGWKECLEYFLIDNWKDCIEKLNEYDNVGVTCNNNWFWGNFWWSQTNHIKKCSEVDVWGRWDYEAWLNKDTPTAKNYEYYKFIYQPYLTYMDPDWYKNPSKFKGSKIILHKASYGTPNFQLDEGQTPNNLGITVDVTEIVRKKLEEHNFEKFQFRVDNDVMGGDPVYGSRKALFVDFSFEVEPNKLYHIGIGEGYNFEFNF